MNEARINQIKVSLAGIGPEINQVYTNEELFPLLEALQAAMANGVFAFQHAEHFEAKDILLHLSTLAAEYGVDNSDAYFRLKANLEQLRYSIGSLIRGRSGERRTQQALRLLSLDQNVEMLFNITLQEDEMTAEYDAIVITPYGIFVIETKNFRGASHITESGILRQTCGSASYDLGERMNGKEYLLRNCLKEAAVAPYYGILLYMDDSTQVIDDYKQIPISCFNTIVSDIRKHDEGNAYMTTEQVREIKQKLLSHHTPNRYPCRINCQQIIDDYAYLIAEIEQRADLSHEDDIAEMDQETVDDPMEEPSSLSKPHRQPVWGYVLTACVMFGLGCLTGIRKRF